MKKFVFVSAALLMCLVLAPMSAQAAAPSIEWEKCLGGPGVDGAFSIQQTSDGGYILAGYTGSTDGNVHGNYGDGNALVVKLNASGAVEWQKSLGGSGWDCVYSIQQTSDDGYIVAGETYSNNGDVSGNHGGYDAWVVKLSASGAIQWQKCLGGSGNDAANSVQQTSDGGYILAGYTESNNGDVSGHHDDGGADAWVVKLDASGAIQWQKCLGGSVGDNAYSIRQTGDGGYILAGYTESNNDDVSGNHGGRDAWVVKLSASGAIQWQKCLGGAGDDDAYSIQQTSDDGYIVAGETFSNDGDVSGNHGYGDAWVVKLDASGAIEWQKCLGGAGWDIAHSIRQTSDGGYIVAGYTSSNNGNVSGNHGGYDAWVVKLNASGAIQWQKCLGGSSWDNAYSIQQTSDGGYIVAGETNSNDGDVSENHGIRDAWVVKLAPDGGGTPPGVTLPPDTSGPIMKDGGGGCNAMAANAGVGIWGMLLVLSLAALALRRK